MSKEYTLIGGNGTRVSPLEVTESGTYEAGDSRAFNPVKVNVPSGSSTLSGLTDVDISNPSNGQTLVYDASSEKWVNGDSAGGALMVPIVQEQDNAILMTPAGEIYAAFANGKNVRVVMEVEDVGVVAAFSLLTCDIDSETHVKTFNVAGLSGQPFSFYAATDEDYPSTGSGDPAD